MKKSASDLRGSILRVLVALALGTLVLSGCSDDGSQTASDDGSQTATVENDDSQASSQEPEDSGQANMCTYSGESPFVSDSTLTEADFVGCVQAWGDAGFPGPDQDPERFVGFDNSFELDMLKDILRIEGQTWEVSNTVLSISSGGEEVNLVLRDKAGKCSDGFFQVRLSASDGSIIGLYEAYLSARINPEEICA